MRSVSDGRFQRQASFLRQQFLQDGSLPLGDVLSEENLSRALATIGDCWVDRIYTPLVTLWVFLGQVLSADHSCRAAVARLIAHRVGRGQSVCSAQTGAYCQARKRLPEAFFSQAALQTGRSLESQVAPEWLWKKRRVYVYDGSTVQMPDTPENQAEYPQNVSQKPGLGFPIARLAAVFSLSCGAILELGICRYAGKGQSELGLLRTRMNIFQPGDVMLGDRLMCAWTEMTMLKERGVDCVCRFTSHRKYDFRKGLRLGEGDHIVLWTKPQRPRSIDRDAYAALPWSLLIRECRVRVARPGFRTKILVLATTLLDPDEYTKEDLAELYRTRWNAELDLRSLKETLQMDYLRCKTPELVRKEIWTHLLAYNLLRTIMAQSAVKQSVAPRTLSFKGAAQMLEAWQPIIAIRGQHNAACRRNLYDQLLDAIAAHRVGHRPGRYEPRRLKRRKKRYDLLTKPRHALKALMARGVIVN